MKANNAKEYNQTIILHELFQLQCKNTGYLDLKILWQSLKTRKTVQSLLQERLDSEKANLL